MKDSLLEKEQAGRVVDLRKIGESGTRPKKINPLPKRSRFFIFRLNFFSPQPKTHRVDFLRHFEKQEKKEDFIEQEILREYLSDEQEETKRGLLGNFADFFITIIKLWWLPLFVIRFIWILFWKIFKLFFHHRAGGASAKKSAAVKVAAAPAVKKEANRRQLKVKKNKGMSFWRSISEIPRRLINFLTGHSRHDDEIHRLWLAQIGHKKFRPWRHFFSFIIVAALIILPLAVLANRPLLSFNDWRGKIVGASEKGISDLQAGYSSATEMNLSAASVNFGSAKENFAEANSDLSSVSGALVVLGKLIPNDKVKLAAHGPEILAAGESAANLGKNLSLAAGSFFNHDGESLSEMIDDFLEYERAALADAHAINQDISGLSPEIIPAEYRDQFLTLKTQGADLEEILGKNIELVEALNVFLGDRSDKRYLFIFENNSEMRASGGFVGSYALVDFSQGKIKNIEAPGGGSYDTEAGLKRLVTAPEPLYLVNPLWHFWDANWWPDWRKSAQKLSWFYEKSDGPTTDGVIAFTPTVLERILQVIGPVDMTDTQGVVITSDNLWENLRTIIDKEKAADTQVPYDLAENKPKKVIGELLTKILAELPARLDKDKFIALANGLEQDLSEKQILLYFNDDNLQSLAEQRNWAGRIKDTNKDYLLVTDTNIAGGKSDRKMVETINHQADVSADGTITDTLTIVRQHTGSIDDPFSGMRNVDWLRIYVPAGSKLLAASGFRGPDPVYFSAPDASWETDPDVAAEEGNNAIIDRANQNTKIYSESGKTVFANWSMVDPGDSSTIVLKYQLPFKLEKQPDNLPSGNGWDALINKFMPVEKKDLRVYSLLAQKQAGSLATTLNVRLNLPAELKIDWTYPDKIGQDSGYTDGTPLDTDKYWAAIIEPIE